MKVKRIIEIDEDTLKFVQELTEIIIPARSGKTLQKNVIEAIKFSKPYEQTGDCISREALKGVIENQDKFACLPDTTLVPFRMLNEPEKNYEPYVHLRDIRNAIDNAPTVERPKGAWLRLPNTPKRSYQRLCTNCYNTSYFCGDGDYPTCPYCLADMKKGGK